MNLGKEREKLEKNQREKHQPRRLTETKTEYDLELEENRMNKSIESIVP